MCARHGAKSLLMLECVHMAASSFCSRVSVHKIMCRGVSTLDLVRVVWNDDRSGDERQDSGRARLHGQSNRWIRARKFIHCLFSQSGTCQHECGLAHADIKDIAGLGADLFVSLPQETWFHEFSCVIGHDVSCTNLAPWNCGEHHHTH